MQASSLSAQAAPCAAAQPSRRGGRVITQVIPPYRAGGSAGPGTAALLLCIASLPRGLTSSRCMAPTPPALTRPHTGWQQRRHRCSAQAGGGAQAGCRARRRRQAVHQHQQVSSGSSSFLRAGSSKQARRQQHSRCPVLAAGLWSPRRCSSRSWLSGRRARASWRASLASRALTSPATATASPSAAGARAGRGAGVVGTAA